MCFWGVFLDLLDGKMELHAFEIIWRCVFGACVFGFGGRQDGLREGGRVCEERGEEMRAPSKHGRRLGLHMSGCCSARGRAKRSTPISVDADADWGAHVTCRIVAVPRPRQTRHARPISVDADWLHMSSCCCAAAAARSTLTSARTPTGVALVGLLLCRARAKAKHAPQLAWTPTGVAQLGLLRCRDRAKPNTHPVSVYADRGCTCHMSGCCCAAQNPTRTPVSLDADWGCTCRAIAVQRQTQHAPRSAWTLLCRGRATSSPPLDLTTTASPMHAHCSPLGKP
jgi:hypothetical protein